MIEKKRIAVLLFCMVIQSQFLGAGSLATTTIHIALDIKIKAEIAATDEDREHGLMNRTSLKEDEGMLFVFPRLDYQGFWMKNTLIALDMIWLNERKEIVYSVTATPCKKDPCDSYMPMQKALYVLEVNGGFVKKHHLMLGQQLQFDLP